MSRKHYLSPDNKTDTKALPESTDAHSTEPISKEKWEYQVQIAVALDWAKQHGATIKFAGGHCTIILNTHSVEAPTLYEAYQAISKKVQA